MRRTRGRRPGAVAAETLETALARAYENNPQLNAQRAIVRQTDEGVPQALSGYRPTVSANATLGRQYTISSKSFRRHQALCRQGRRSRPKA